MRTSMPECGTSRNYWRAMAEMSALAWQPITRERARWREAQEFRSLPRPVITFSGLHSCTAGTSAAATLPEHPGIRSKYSGTHAECFTSATPTKSIQVAGKPGKLDRFSQGSNTGRELNSLDCSRSLRHAGDPIPGSLVWMSAALLGLLLSTTFLDARTHRSQAWAENQFAKAEAQRETLNGQAEQSRTRRQYEAVIAAYRLIVLEAPTSSKADASAFAVAEITAEMGRHFKDDMALYSAIREYKFLRREYPGSKHRIEALFAIGEIYKNDLGDDTDANAAFAELLRRYPHSQSAAEARAQLGPALVASSNSENVKSAAEADLK